mgnify:CR=1 FL=1
MRLPPSRSSRASRTEASRCRPPSSSTRQVGRLDTRLRRVRASAPTAFRALAPADKVSALREAGASIGDGVDLGDGSLVIAPRIVIEDGVHLGPRATVVCEEVVAIGELSQLRADLELRCRRAFVGSGLSCGRSVRFGRRRASRSVGDARRSEISPSSATRCSSTSVGPVLIGREVFLTMRAMIVTHNIGHSVLEGFENRFASVVLEDRSADRPRRSASTREARIGCGSDRRRRARTWSATFHPGAFAIGVPAKVTGSSSHKLSDARGGSSWREDDRRPARASSSAGSCRVCNRGDDPRVRDRRNPGRNHGELPRWRATRPRSFSRSTCAATCPTASRWSTCSAAASRERRRRPRLGTRVLPQAWYPTRARPLELSGGLV